MLWIDVKYVGIVGARLENFKKLSENTWNFRCPFCGDSHKNRYKSRGYVYAVGQRLLYKCHNCGYGTTLGGLLDHVDPTLHSEYRLEVLREKGPRPDVSYRARNEDLARLLSKHDSTARGILTTRLSSLHPDHSARVYAAGRKWPEEAYPGLFFLEDGSKLVELNEAYAGRLPEDPRIVFPIYDSEGVSVIGCQGRAILPGDHRLRYATVRCAGCETLPLVYGLDRLNYEERVYVLEGAPDSLFIPNSVAVLGSDLKRAAKMLPTDAVYVFDCEPRNREIVRKMETAMRAGRTVCVLPHEYSGMDINDMVLRGMSRSEVKKMIDSRAYSGVKLKLEIGRWRR